MADQPTPRDVIEHTGDCLGTLCPGCGCCIHTTGPCPANSDGGCRDHLCGCPTDPDA